MKKFLVIVVLGFAVFIVSIPQTSAQNKVTICHFPPGDPDNRRTISIDESAVPAHLQHGDFIGECPPKKAAEIADAHAKVVWSDSKSLVRGMAFPVFTKDNKLLGYVFHYALDATEFPAYETIFDAVRRVRAQYPGSDDRFYPQLEKEIGKFGCVEVAATTGHFPVLLVRHSLHPYFLYSQDATVEASRRLNTSQVWLEKVLFFGPHEEYFQFNSPMGTLRLHAFLLTPEGEIIPSPPPDSVGALTEMAPNPQTVKQSAIASNEAMFQAPAAASTTYKMLTNLPLVPVVDWTHWCTPTAMTMAAGYYDHYAPGFGMLNYGRIIDFWKDHPTDTCGDKLTNVPNFIDNIIDHMMCNWSSKGLIGTLNIDDGYNFKLTTVPGTQSNDWNWPLITAEVDAERPCLWGVGPQAGHTMTVIGYRIIGSQKFVIVYNTWGASAAQQLYEYNYREWKGAPNTDTSVGVLEPGGSPGVVQAAVTYPRGGELVFGPTTITWYVWGDQIKSTSVWFSKTGGGSWQFLTGQPTQPGFNSFTTNLLDETSHARISIDCFSESGERLASDGSIKNFYVSGKADLVPVPDAGGFCQIDNGGNLIIKVKNQGSSAAPSSMTFVQFFCINDTTEIHQLATPAIPPGEVAELTVKIPSTCYHPDCNFIITVDSNHNVDEANEDNNSVQGACI